MSRTVTLRHGRAVQVGDAVVHVEWAHRGEARLVVEAPIGVAIQILPRAASPDICPDLPITPPCLTDCEDIPADDIPF